MESMSTENPSVSSSSTTRRKHKVYLSFRGLDTRMGFVDHLYVALLRKGILIFRDVDQDLQMFEGISKAIQESMYAVVIITPNYCSSRWCLTELIEIMECTKKTGLIVLPVFYRMDPSDVRKQTGAVGEALAMHEDKSQVDTETIQKWRATLTDVGNIAGWIVDDGIRDQSAVLEITTHIFNQLYYRVSLVDQLVIGIGSRLTKVMDMMFGMEFNGVRFVGIYGIGGTGKTTLTKVLYDIVSLQFEASSFISSVREETGKYGLVSLQNKIISDILKTQEINMPDLNEGVNVLENQMRDRKIFIVLDDVDSETQLEVLVGSHDWFGSGSKIILTSRDGDLLRRYVDDVYEIEKLNNDEALELFSLSAFKQHHPDENYVALSKEFISYAHGHPLTLKVLGFSLSGRRIGIWKSDLDKLRVDPNKELLRNGKYRYDYCGRNQNHIEAIDLWVGSLAFLLEFALVWVANSKAFERVVLVVSWINCLTTWAVFLWRAKSRGARFALPRFVLPNQQPYGCTVDYFDKYAAIALIIFSTIHMIVRFTAQKFSTSGLVLSGVILGAKLGIEHQKRHSD